MGMLFDRGMNTSGGGGTVAFGKKYLRQKHFEMDALTSSTHKKLLAITLQTQPQITSRVELVGVVSSFDRAPKFLKFHVDDGSGCISCILWLNHRHRLHPGSSGDIAGEVEAEMSEEMESAVKLGKVVRVRGRVGFFRGEVQVTVLDLRVEIDPNFEIFHWLQCIKLARNCYGLEKK